MSYRLGQCTSCKARYKIPASFTAKRAKCKTCSGVVEIGPVIASQSDDGEPSSASMVAPGVPPPLAPPTHALPPKEEPAPIVAPRAELPEAPAFERASPASEATHTHETAHVEAPPLARRPERAAAPAPRDARSSARKPRAAAAPEAKKKSRAALVVAIVVVLAIVAAILAFWRHRSTAQASSPSSTSSPSSIVPVERNEATKAPPLDTPAPAPTPSSDEATRKDSATIGESSK
jgi:hypothetical protein